MTKPLESFNGYRAGHPSYYRLGGPIPTPKQIRADVQNRDYRGYLADHIDNAAAKPEPQRSEALRALRGRVLEEMRADLKCYRECARELRRFRNARMEDDRPIICDVYTALSLKTAHLINAFANLRTIDEALSVQGDLFGF